MSYARNMKLVALNRQLEAATIAWEEAKKRHAFWYTVLHSQTTPDMKVSLLHSLAPINPSGQIVSADQIVVIPISRLMGREWHDQLVAIVDAEAKTVQANLTSMARLSSEIANLYEPESVA